MPTPLDRLRRLLWPDGDPRARRRTIWLAWLTTLAVGPQILLWDWYVEDAAISFAYARHLAHGDGLVAFVGGERIEGYSNPLWVLLLTPLELVDVSAFAAATRP